MPALIQMMNNETVIKMQTHAASTAINFVKGLIDEEEEEEVETTNTSKTIMLIYAKDLFNTLTNLLKKAMIENYEPLQEEVLNLLSVTATLIENDFSQYYSTFMPMMVEILQNIGTTT